MTIICPCCGTEQPDNLKRCPECGLELEQYFNDENKNITKILLARAKAAYANKTKAKAKEREREEQRKQREAEETLLRGIRHKEGDEWRQKAKGQQGQAKTGGALKVSPLKMWQDFNAFKVLITQNLVSAIWTLSLVAIVFAVIGLDKPEMKVRVWIGLGVALAVRIVLEFVVVLFSIANSLREIKEELCQGREKKNAAK